jgi:16S rRNA (adenine1518-N6/adenine1519-N6)-dimethyltransferase
MTDIMMKVFEESVNARKIVYMVEEAALDRILCESSTKSYGPLAVVSELYGNISIVSKVPGICFVPMPRTTSAVISFNCHENRPDKDLMAFIKTCFAQRRKTLSNNLKGCDKDKLNKWVKENFITESIRAEALEPTDFRDLYNALK